MATIRERIRKDGSASFAVLYRDGKRQSSRTFEDQKSARKFAALLDVMSPAEALALITGTHETATVRMTLDDLAARYFEDREADVASGELTPRVLASYREQYAAWISPMLGRLAVDSITDIQTQELVDSMKARRAAPKSIRTRLAILSGMFVWGSQRGRRFTTTNPCVGLDLPPMDRKPPKGLSVPELQALLAAAEAVTPEGADLIAFLASTGWRIGEAIALTAGQVEDDGTNVWATVNRVWRRDVGFAEDSAKSEAGMRRVRVIEPGAGVLRRRLVGKGPGDLVFSSPRREAWNENTFRREHWARAVKAAGLEHRKPTPHWLRHTHVFLCHAAGMSLPEIQRRIGHSDIRLTINTYGRLIDGMSDEVAGRIEALLTTPVVRGEVVE